MRKGLYDTLADKWLKDCDSVWVYSDPHFSDLDSYKLRFPVTFKASEDIHTTLVNLLDNEQIKNINAKCGKTACLIILGDVGNIECVKKLKAKYKVLIMGNHDKGASNYKRVVKPSEKKIAEIIGSREVTSEEKDFITVYVKSGMLMGFNDYIDDNHLFDEIYEGPLFINDKLVLSHEPIISYNNCFFNIHGHVHNKAYTGDATHLNVCAEVVDYEPINIIKLIQKGLLKDIDNIHRQTIDIATKRKNK